MTPFWAGVATGLAILFAKSPGRACLSVIVFVVIMVVFVAMMVAAMASVLVAAWQITLPAILFALALVVVVRIVTLRAKE